MTVRLCRGPTVLPRSSILPTDASEVLAGCAGAQRYIFNHVQQYLSVLNLIGLKTMDRYQRFWEHLAAVTSCDVR